MKHRKLVAALFCASTMAMGAGLLAACGGHTHSWKWQSNAEEHWQMCEEDSTEKEGSRGPHVDANEDGECDTCERELPPTQTEDLFPADYIGTWQYKMGDTVMGTLEIEANAAKFSGTAVTAAKATGKEGYTFTAENVDYSFALTSDKYALLLTSGGTDGFTFTMLKDDFDATEDPGFISAPTEYTGSWIDADTSLTLSFGAGDEAGEMYLNSDPITILTLAADKSSATALILQEDAFYWAEIHFGTAEISVNIAGMGTFTFLPLPETIEFPSNLRANWAEYGKADGHTLTIATHAITFDGEDVTASAIYNEDEAKYYFLAGGETEYSFALTQDGNILYMQSDGSAAYILFGTIDEEGESELPDLPLSDLAGKTYLASSTSTAGDLIFDAAGKATLGGKAIRILHKDTETVGGGFSPTIKTTGFTFICGGMWYRAAVEDIITLTDLDNKTYKFDGESLSDLTEYVGEWKQFHPYTTTTVTITATEFQYNGKTKQCFKGLDGSLYYKDGAFRTPFGYLDEEGTILYLRMSSTYWFFTKDGERPTVTSIPEAFRGNWTSDNYFGLKIGASSITVDDKAYTPFAVTGEEGEEAIHAITNNNGYVIFTMGKDDAGEDAVLMSDGSMKLATFSAVKSEPLPQAYQGDWNALSGEDTVSVDTDGKFTYNGTVYATTIDERTGSYHFTTDAGDVATIEASSDGYVLWIDHGNGTVTYFTKVALTELPDIKMTAFKDTAWSSMDLGGAKLTFDADGAATIEGKKVQILTQEADNADTIGTLIYDNTWYDFRISGATITFQGHDGEIIFTKQGAQLTFTAPEAMTGKWNEIGGMYGGMTVEIGDTVIVGSEALTDLSAEANTIHGKWDGSACTITLMDENTIYVSVSGVGDIFFAKDGTASLPLTAIAERSWEEDTLGTFTVDAEGGAKLGGVAVYISTVTMSGLNGDTFAGFTVVTKDKWYKVEIDGDTLIFTDTEDNEYTFTAPGSRTYADELCGEWILKTFLAPEYTGGTSKPGPQYTLKIEANKLTWEGVTVTSTDETDGKYSFTTTSPIEGSGETTYTFWLQGDDILLLDDGTNTYALFRSTWEDNLESSEAQQVPSEIATGDWTGANGEKLNISPESDSDTGHEAFITVRGKGLDGNAIWLFAGATATLCKGYCKPDGPSHYVYAEMSLSGTTLTVKLFFKFAEPEIYTFTQKPAEETYTTPNGMRDTWILLADGALDSSHTIDVTKDSIKVDGVAVTGVTVEDDVVTFTANGKKYTATTAADDYVLCLQAEGEETYTMYVSSLLDEEGEKAGGTLKGTTWTGEKGDLVIAADGSATFNGKAAFGVAEMHIGVTSFTFVADGMLYVAKLSGTTLTLTDLNGHTYTYTKAA